MKKMLLTSLLTAFLAGACLLAQPYTTLTSGLNAPVGLVYDDCGNLWISESGTGNDDARVTIRKPDGTTSAYIDNLPSQIDAQGDPVGVWHTLLTDEYVVLVTGEGTKPLMMSLLFFARDPQDCSPSVTLADLVRSVSVFDFASSALGNPTSNPYSIAQGAGDLFYVVDAFGNAVYTYDFSEDAFSILVQFPDFPNPLPFGPPTSDAVPTKILAMPNGNLLVSTLSGFPFAPGVSTIFEVQPDGSYSVYASGLTSTVDMAIDPRDGNPVVLQFAEFGQFGFAPGTSAITKIFNGGTLEPIVTGGFGPSAGLLVDSDGRILVSSIGTGEVLELDAAILIPTMSEWALFLFGLTIVTLGVVFAYNMASLKEV